MMIQYYRLSDGGDRAQLAQQLEELRSGDQLNIESDGMTLVVSPVPTNDGSDKFEAWLEYD